MGASADFQEFRLNKFLAIWRQLLLLTRFSTRTQIMLLSIILFSPFLAQGSVPGGGIGGLLPIILLFAGMWFLLIAPQRKRQKEHDKMVSELKKGDKVVTSGGLFGTIAFVKKDRLVVEIAENIKVELGKQFISSKIEPEETKK